MKHLFLAAVATVVSLPAAAQFQKPEDAVKYRKAAFTVMAAHFTRIGAMVNGKAPFDAKAAAANADVMAALAKLPFDAFGAGTDKVGDTKSRPEVWTEGDKFRASTTKMMEEVAKLQTAAKGGKPDEIKAAFGATAKSCKACHDNFRKE